jgi:hypothetical protein
VSVEQLLYRFNRVMVQTMQMLAWGFEPLQMTAMNLVLCQRDPANLFKQVLFAFRCKQGLARPQLP